MWLLNTSTLIEVTVPGDAGPFPRINQQLAPLANQPCCFAHGSFLMCRPGGWGGASRGWGRRACLHSLCWAWWGESCLKEAWSDRSSVILSLPPQPGRISEFRCRIPASSTGGLPGVRRRARGSLCTVSSHPYGCLGKLRPRDLSLRVLAQSPTASKGLTPIQGLTLITHRTTD